MTELTIKRLADSAGVWRRIKVEVDGELVARLRPKQSSSVFLSPGRHEVRAKMDWCSSPTVSIEGQATVEIEYPFASWRKLLRHTDEAIHIAVVEQH